MFSAWHDFLTFVHKPVVCSYLLLNGFPASFCETCTFWACVLGALCLRHSCRPVSRWRTKTRMQNLGQRPWAVLISCPVGADVRSWCLPWEKPHFCAPACTPGVPVCACAWLQPLGHSWKGATPVSVLPHGRTVCGSQGIAGSESGSQAQVPGSGASIRFPALQPLEKSSGRRLKGHAHLGGEQGCSDPGDKGQQAVQSPRYPQRGADSPEGLCMFPPMAQAFQPRWGQM